MNSYNENLHAGVVASLQALEQEQKTVDSSVNAAMFTLYYAQGATITTAGKLSGSEAQQDFQAEMKIQAVENSNLSTNLLASANQGNKYLQQSVTNVSVAAANVQQASNAIVRLSGDMGGIFNIVNAANFDTDIYTQAQQANLYMSNTAYEAELASQLSMEASVATAEVSGATVASRAASTNTAMGSLLAVVSKDYDTISATVTADNASLAADTTVENIDKGLYSDITAIQTATNNAYATTSKDLNLGLLARPVTGNEATQFNVQFETIRSPFPLSEGQSVSYYPVQDYYLIFAKDDQKTAFSINNAEDIRQSYPLRCIHLDTTTTDPLPLDLYIRRTFDYTQIPANGSTYKLQDADGDLVVPGTAYVVFLMAVYYDDYKKKLNTFDDYLSAASPTFGFSNVLSVAQFTGTATGVPSSTLGGAPGVPVNNLINFTVTETPVSAGKVEYRCILLPMNNLYAQYADAIAAGATSPLKSLELTISGLKEKEATLESSIATTTAAIESTKVQLAGIIPANPKLNGLVQYVFQDFRFWVEEALQGAGEATASTGFMQLFSSRNPSALTGLTDEQKKDLNNFISLLVQEYNSIVQLRGMNQQLAGLQKQLQEHEAGLIDFVFNLPLAMQVSPANYMPAQVPVISSDDSSAPPSTTGDTDSTAAKKSSAKAKKDDDTTADAAADTPPAPTGSALSLQFEVTADTTDNFGNPLQRNTDTAVYIPVILSVLKAGDQARQQQFTNVWTGYGINSPRLSF